MNAGGSQYIFTLLDVRSDSIVNVSLPKLLIRFTIVFGIDPHRRVNKDENVLGPAILYAEIRYE